MNFFFQYFAAFFDLLKDLWIWMLLGFFIAGFVEEFVPVKTLLKYFGQNNFASIARASLAGLVMSICSCGAIPISVTLRNKGATTACALTFLLAAPWAGFVHLIILNGFIGPKASFLIFIFSILVALLSGLVFGILEKKKIIDQRISAQLILDAHFNMKKHEEKPFFNRVPFALKDSWEGFWDIGKFILYGLLLAAFLKAFIPSSIISHYLGVGSKFNPIITAIPFSIIFELCSEGFSVFAGQLYTMGATLGVVFIMLMIGVTSDFTELSVIWGKFGKRSAFFYLLVSSLIALAAAHLLDFLWR